MIHPLALAAALTGLLGAAAACAAPAGSCTAGLDFGAADSTLNAPCATDSRFVVLASRADAALMEAALHARRSSPRADLKAAADESLPALRALRLEFAAIERQKAWTLPPPDVARYRWREPVVYDDGTSIVAQRAAARDLVALFRAEAVQGDAATLRRLAARSLPRLEHQLRVLEALPG